MPRSEMWERDYLLKPYFRRFDNEWLRWMFVTILSENGKGMIKGGTEKQKHDAKFFWMEIFTHMMAEINFRGLDLRFFTENRDLLKELDAEMVSRFRHD